MADDEKQDVADEDEARKERYRCLTLQYVVKLIESCTAVLTGLAEGGEEVPSADKLGGLLSYARHAHDFGLHATGLAPAHIVEELAQATAAARKRERDALLSYIADNTD